MPTVCRSPDGSTWYDAIVINGATGQCTLTSAASSSFANRFRNGTMDVAQRGAGPLSVATSGAYTLDGWIVVPSGAGVTAQQVAGRGPTLYSLKIAGAASVTDVIVKQRIESFLAAILSGQTVTVQAQVYNNTGATITPTLTIKHASAQDNWASATSDVSGANLQACANAAWTKVAYTFIASSSAGNGLEVSFDFGNNFGSTANSIQLTELDIRVTPNIATGLNGNPPAVELRPIMQELAFCQRYYEILNYDSGGAAFFGLVYGSGNNQGFWYFAVTKRAVPTVALVSGAWQVAMPTIQQAVNFVRQLNTSTAPSYLLGTAGNVALSASAEL